DITYGTNNEYGFDYLHDNMALSKADKVRRPLNLAMLDRVDPILIDEARTPLVLSGPAESSSELYKRMNQLVRHLKPQKEEGGEGDYSVDEKTRQVELTEEGHQHVEDLLIEAKLLQPDQNLYAANNLTLLHHVNSALRA